MADSTVRRSTRTRKRPKRFVAESNSGETDSEEVSFALGEPTKKRVRVAKRTKAKTTGTATTTTTSKRNQRNVASPPDRNADDSPLTTMTATSGSTSTTTKRRALPSAFKTKSRPKSKPPKRSVKRTEKECDGEEGNDGEEKRLRRYRSAPTAQIKQRIARVMSQRMFLLSRKPVSDELSRGFAVLGSTGNAYDVTIERLPRCSCPDFARGNHCKHILFVVLKVLKVPRTDPKAYQAAYLGSELREIFATAPNDPSVEANKLAQKAYKKAVGELDDDDDDDDDDDHDGPSDKGEDPKIRKAIEGDCAVCCEEMSSREKTMFCPTCGNNLHTQCWNEWSSAARNKGATPTCVYCRAEMPIASTSLSVGGGPPVATKNGRYLNLAEAQGLSTNRDTSSYHYPWRYGGGNGWRRNWRRRW